MEEGDDDGMFEISYSEVLYDGLNQPEFEFLAHVPLDDMSVRQEDVVLTKSIGNGMVNAGGQAVWMDPYVSMLAAGLVLAGVILRNTVLRGRSRRRRNDSSSSRSSNFIGAAEPEVDALVEFSATLLLRRLDDLEGALAVKNGAAEESCLGLDVERVASSSSSLAAVLAAGAASAGAASAAEPATLSVLERVERVIARLIDNVRAVQRGLQDASYPQLDFLRDRIDDFEAIAGVLVTLRRVRDALEQRLYVATKDPLEEARAALQLALDDEDELKSSTAALVAAMAVCAECGDKAGQLYLAASAALDERHAAEDDRMRQSLARRAQVEMQITSDTMSMASVMLQNGRAGGGLNGCVSGSANPFACLENGGVNRTLSLDALDALEADEAGDSAQPAPGSVNTITVAAAAGTSGLVVADRQPHAGMEALVVPFALELNKVRRDLNNELERSLLELQKRRDALREGAQRDAKRDARQREQEARETAHRHKLLQEQRSARTSFDEELYIKWRTDVFARHDTAKRRQLEADFYYVVVLTNAAALLAFGLVTTRCRLGHGWALQQARCLCAALSSSGQQSSSAAAATASDEAPQGIASLVFSFAGRATGRATLALVQLFQGWDGAWVLHDLSVCAVKTLLSVLGPLVLSRIVGLVHKPTARLILLGGVLWTLWEPASLVFASLWQTCLLAAFNCGYYYLLLSHCDPRLTWAGGPNRGPDWRRVVVYVLAPLWLVAFSLLLACEATSTSESRGLHLGPRFTWETAREALARAC